MDLTAPILKTPSLLSSIPQVTYTNGVGFLGTGAVPVAFQSLNSFSVYWNITARSLMIQGTPFSLNGVPVSNAVCVRGAGVVGLGWLLYVAPAQVSLASHYIIGWLNAVPGATMGAVATVASSVGYVGIAAAGTNSGFSCNPTMSKLTQIG
jgi:hypothetical protein